MQMRAFAALMLLLWVVSADAGWRNDVQSARLVGEGDFSVFGFSLYRAWRGGLTSRSPQSLQ
jgi:hypothetical protein